MLAINIYVLTKLRLGILNMHHLIVGQVGIKIIISITGGEESNPLWRICFNQDGRASSANKISLANLKTKHAIEEQSQCHEAVLKAKLLKDLDLLT